MNKKYHAANLRYKRKYYGRTANLYERRPWDGEEDDMVLEHKITDSEMSPILRRSVGAIQQRRHHLRKAMSVCG